MLKSGKAMIMPMTIKMAGLINFFMVASLQQDVRLNSLALKTHLLSDDWYRHQPGHSHPRL
jgi:hypothetical protein